MRTSVLWLDVHPEFSIVYRGSYAAPGKVAPIKLQTHKIIKMKMIKSIPKNYRVSLQTGGWLFARQPRCLESRIFRSVVAELCYEKIDIVASRSTL
jgi:hypothetical protein